MSATPNSAAYVYSQDDVARLYERAVSHVSAGEEEMFVSSAGMEALMAWLLELIEKEKRGCPLKHVERQETWGCDG